MKPTPAVRTTLACCDLLHPARRGTCDRRPASDSISSSSFWNPSSGLALALLTLLGPGFFPVVLAANLLTAFTGSALPFWWLKLLLPVVFTANYAGMAWGIRRLVGFVPLLRDFRDTLVFMLATGAAPVAASFVSSRLLQGAGLAAPGGLFPLVVQGGSATRTASSRSCP